MGHGGGQVLNVLGFYSAVPSLNTAEAQVQFFVQFGFEKNENKQKEAGDCPFLKKLPNDESRFPTKNVLKH